MRRYKIYQRNKMTINNEQKFEFRIIWITDNNNHKSWCYFANGHDFYYKIFLPQIVLNEVISIIQNKVVTSY